MKYIVIMMLVILSGCSIIPFLSEMEDVVEDEIEYKIELNKAEVKHSL